MKVCKVEGCEKPYHAKGFCCIHYGRLKRHGDTERLSRKKDALTCPVCHKKVPVVDMFKIYEYENSERRGYCSEECHIEALVKMELSMGKRITCNVLRAHAETVKDDPEALGAEWIADFVGVQCDKKPSAEEIREQLRKEIKGV